MDVFGISIAKNLENVQVAISDISKEALEIAKKNAETNSALNKIEIIESNMFENIKETYDIIVSNPPYIETDEIKKLTKDVQNEPIQALDGGKDGLTFYRKIAEDAPEFLNIHGFLCFEIGYNQKQKVKQILEKQKRYINIYCKKDLCENDRVVVAQLS